MRIVSLSPAATEIVFGLGLGDELVGRTHACDHPEAAAEVPVVTAPPREPGGSRGPGRDAGTRVEARLLAALEPDLLVTHSPDAGGVAGTELAGALRALPRTPAVVTLDPRSLEGILNSIASVGAFAEAEDEAVGLIELARERLAGIEDRVLERRLQGIPARRVVVLEWLGPPRASGQWVPEMVRRAGGWELLGREGEPAAETTWERVREVDPEQLVLAVRGLDAPGAAEALASATLPAWFDRLSAVTEGELFAVDGAGLFSRPGPRIFEGIALLAELFDPEGFAGSGPTEAWVPLGPVGAGRPR